MDMTFSPKDPAEVIYYGIDFADLLGATETLASASASLRALVMDDAGTATMLSGLAIVDGTIIKQLITGGLAGNTYRLALSAVTSAGQTFVESRDIAVVGAT